MLRLIMLSFLFGSGFLYAQDLLINELDGDTPSIDDMEFVELRSAASNFSTNGYILVFFNGSTSGDDSSYLAYDLAGYETDSNGLLVLGNVNVSPFPQVITSDNLIQNGADAVAIYQTSIENFPEGTKATTDFNLIDAMVYGTNDTTDTILLGLLGQTTQYNDNGTNSTPKSIQRFVDAMDNVTYAAATPTPRADNDGNGIDFNAITISVSQTQLNEGEDLTITFTAEDTMTSDLNFNISLNNFGFGNSDYTGATSLTILIGQNETSTVISLTDDLDDEGDEVLKIQFLDLEEPIIAGNNFLEVRVVDNDFTVAEWGTPVNPTYDKVTSTQADGYYDSLDGLAGEDLKQAIQDIISDPTIVRAQTYSDVIDILKEADQNPENSNEVWLVYSEEGRPKLDFQTSSDNTGKWNREHTFPRSRAGYFSIEEDDIADGIDVFWQTNADSLRHGNSDAYGLRAADAAENSIRGNDHYGIYNGPTGNEGSFKGDVARSVFFIALRYNGLSIVDGFPALENPTTGELGDLATLLQWHRDDPVDDFEMNKNNVIANWQKNRNPLIDQPLLVEYIWGNQAGNVWSQSLSTDSETELSFQLYPNPANGTLFVSGLESDFDVDIFSTDGKLVYSEKAVKNKISLNLTPGMYLVKIANESGASTKKIILK
ncbi:endonuclease [Winogradskyella sp. A3E31]|uniref:endonuclease n=1 Tax=Winogradskyella sp. A3E31 TaxID=3349637 RepID=UPI00398AE924